ncbi:MAG TPA: thioredoxin fold domain-containing protein [Burkholderiales bacterium]|nr:thioredoxin fold domain-containing protein [Burkholderiales bacterium]
MRLLPALAVALALAPAAALAEDPSPHAIEIPAWFAETFLDFRDDVRDAAKDGRRVMVYFGQDGCPYCTQLMKTNFSQQRLVEKTRKHFVAIALNIWGDREVTWVDGRTMSEKALALALKVQFTPTLLFLDEQGAIVARVNGFYPPHRFEAVIDYVSGKMESKLPFAEHMRAAGPDTASPELADEPFFLKPPYDLRRKPGARPLAVIFETPYCTACEELHADGFSRAGVKRQLERFDVVRFGLAERTALVTPQGAKTTAEAWARALKVSYTPTVILFDGGREVLRIEAYVRAFHLAGGLDYVASGGYRKEPSFQRYLQRQAEKMRDRGERVELWQ